MESSTDVNEHDNDSASCSVASAQSHVNDGALVGTLQLLQESPNVTLPKTVNTPVPVPSVYMDDRGEIFNILAGSKRINVLTTKRGVMRSGDIHKNTQHDFVFEGRVQVWLLQKDGSTLKKTYGPYQYIRVPPLVPHVFEFLQDSVIAEWWEPEPFEAYFYTPYRNIVQQSFSSTTEGKLIKLVAEKEGSEREWSTIAGVIGGIVFGLAVGIMVGRRK